MKIGSLIGDILKSFFKKPATILYPVERIHAPERYRGQLFWEPEKCSGCQLCVKDCPSNAIELIVLDKVNKRFVMRYDKDKCTYCAQCVASCRFACLNMNSDQWELASLRKEPFTVYYGKDEDVSFLLAERAATSHLHSTE
jgi:formate hydrogenlyase subunit 6/NADH:ubiquinone oxidoreductase subunit I